jgi:hypothetical protein
VQLYGEKAADDLIALWEEAEELFVTHVEESSRQVHKFMEKLGFLERDLESWNRAFDEQMEALDPLGKLTVTMLKPALEAYVWREAVHRAKVEMLDAAMSIKLSGKEGLENHPDPFGDGPFAYRKTAHGFRLISNLEKDGKPVTIDVGRQENGRGNT